MESVIVECGFRICLVNCYVNKVELMSLHSVLLFYQLRYELAPVQIYGDLVGSRLPTFISDISGKVILSWK